MADDVIIIDLSEKDQWNAEYGEGGLPSQSWHYAWGLNASGFDPKLAVVKSQGARMLLPFFERRFMGTTDIATIPGLSGASIVPSSSAPLALWEEYASSRGWVAGYIQLAAGIELKTSPPRSELFAQNSMFVIDVSEWDINRSISRKFRKHIHQGRRRGAIVVDDCARLAERLRSLYPESTQRMGVRQTFSAESIERWVRDPSVLALGAEVGDRIDVIHLQRINAAHAEGHIAAVGPSGRGLGAWLVWKAIERLRTLGVRHFNIGGGVHASDNLSAYKLRFGATELPMISVRQIYDRPQYDALCSATSTSAEDHWFPAYRRAYSAD